MTDECFGPIVGRHNGRPIYRFSNLLWTPPYVWSFNIDFPRLVIQREALAQAMSMMPKGSNVRRVVVVRPKAGSCALFVVRSSQLAAATGPLMLSELEVALFTPGNLNTGTYDSRKVATLVVQALWGQPYRTCVAAALGGVTSGPGWHA